MKVTLLGGVLLIGLVACGRSSEPAQQRGPVILFLVDTLRADHLGCYGYARETSPALDALAADGVRFEACQAQSSWTKPATASILTGLLPSAHRAVHKVSALPPEHLLLAEPLAEQGYATAAFGNNGFIFGPEQGFSRGFDVFESGSQLTGEVDTGNHLGAEVLVDASLAWLDGLAQGTQPFLYVHAVDPHDPYDPPAELRNLFTEPLGAGQPTDAELARPAALLKRQEGLSTGALARMVGLYDAEILAADRAFGRLVEGLEARGLYDDALILFVADHGEEFADHGGFGHNPALFQEVTRVPLVVKFPASLSAERRAALVGRTFEPRVRQVDLLPTVLDVLGIELPEARQAQLAGASVLPALLEPGSAGPLVQAWSQRPSVTEVDYQGVYRKSLIQGPFKYVQTWVPAPSQRLFNLAEDPGERHDLAAQDERRAADMHAELGRSVDLGRRGWGLMLRNQTDEPLRVAGLLTFAGAPLEGLDPLHMELSALEGVLADGPLGQGWVSIEELEPGRGRFRYGLDPEAESEGQLTTPVLSLGGLGSYSGRAAWFFATVEGHGEDGIVFVPGAGTRDLSLTLWGEGQLVPPEFVFQGPWLEPATSMPYAFGTGAGLELPAEPLRDKAPEGLPMFAWIWKNLDPGSLDIELAPETEANLRDLGYFGDD